MKKIKWKNEVYKNTLPSDVGLEWVRYNMDNLIDTPKYLKMKKETEIILLPNNKDIIRKWKLWVKSWNNNNK